MEINQNLGHFRKFPTFAEGHNSGTEHATGLKFVPKCEFNNHLSFPTPNSISQKSGLSTFWSRADLHIQHWI